MRCKPDYALVRARDRRCVRSCHWAAMRHHESDHRALVMRVESDLAGVKHYDKARRTFPAPPLCRPLAIGDAMFEELVGTLEKPPVKERPENAWVHLGTWSRVDRRAELRKAGRLTQRESRRLARAIRASLKLDRQERASAEGRRGHRDGATGGQHQGGVENPQGLASGGGRRCHQAVS